MSHAKDLVSRARLSHESLARKTTKDLPDQRQTSPESLHDARHSKPDTALYPPTRTPILIHNKGIELIT